jgi:hypothetical protein
MKSEGNVEDEWSSPLAAAGVDVNRAPRVASRRRPNKQAMSFSMADFSRKTFVARTL